MKKFEQLNNIPILEIANILGIALNSSKSIDCFKGHDNKSPSLKFYENTNTYYCYGCGIGSKPINLVMDFYEISFIEAYKILENKFFRDSSYNLPKFKKAVTKQEKTFFVPDIEIYQSIVTNNILSSKGISYLESRGYKQDFIEKYKVFDIEEPYDFFRKLKEIWGEERLYRCGLLKIKDERYLSAWWKYTIVFPYFDLDNNIIYLQGRYLTESKNELRWVNMPNIKSSLYNLNILNTCEYGEQIYICEGITDALSLNQIGKKALAVMGANNFKKEYIFLLKDYDIWVVPDNDSGGEKFFADVQEKFSNYLSVKRFPLNKDYNDITDFLQGIKNV